MKIKSLSAWKRPIHAPFQVDVVKIRMDRAFSRDVTIKLRRAD